MKSVVSWWLQDDLYAPYLGQLAKLAFLASAVHQAVFTVFSTLPFAVGQVRSAWTPEVMVSAHAAFPNDVVAGICYCQCSCYFQGNEVSSWSLACVQCGLICEISMVTGPGRWPNISERHGNLHSAPV